MNLRMKTSFLLSILIAVICLTGCQKTSTSVIVPLDGSKEGTIANQDYELTIKSIKEIDSVKLGDRRVSVSSDLKETHALYEVRTRYVNLTDAPKAIYYKELIIDLPDMEADQEMIRLVGYCLQEEGISHSLPTRCAYVPPPPKPGVYGVQGVYVGGVYEPGSDEEADFYMYVIVEKSQPSIQIAFKPVEEE